MHLKQHFLKRQEVGYKIVSETTFLVMHLKQNLNRYYTCCRCVLCGDLNSFSRYVLVCFCELFLTNVLLGASK